MWAVLGRLRQADIAVDEMMGAVERGIVPAERAAESGGGVLGWLIALGLVVLVVLGMLLMLWGQQRRREREDDTLGFDRYAVREDHPQRSPFAQVEIENAEPEASFDPEEPEPFEAAFDDAPLDEDERNVVPIRRAEERQAPEVLRFAREEEREASHRYAFGGGAYAEPNDGFAPVPTPQGGARQSGFETRSEYRGEGPRGEDAAFGPHLREDLERSERRQADRLDSFRDEVSRQFQAMKNENASRLDLFVSSVDRKLEGVGTRGGGEAVRAVENALRPVYDRLDTLAGHVTTQDRRLGDLAQLLERRLRDLPPMSRELTSTAADVRALAEELRGARQDLVSTSEQTRGGVDGLGSDVAGLRDALARLERLVLDRAQEEGGLSVALSEVVRGTLPEAAYAFKQKLGNGETADCLISFRGLRERVAIDANFPMEAFGQLPSRDAIRKNLPQAKNAEDLFRRAILRAILEAADRCIVPGETTDSCLLFLPSEAAYTVLHDRFGDLVRDAQRARVWLTSPSTLMGTLNLLSNLMPQAEGLIGEDTADREPLTAYGPAPSTPRENETARREAERREQEREALRAEIGALRERAAGLAAELDRTRGTLGELISTTERLSVRGEGTSAQRAAASAAPRAVEADPTPAREFDYQVPDWSDDDREHRYHDED